MIIKNLQDVYHVTLKSVSMSDTDMKSKKPLVILSTDDKDREGDVLLQDNIEFGEHIPLLVNHRDTELPIGRLENVEVREDGLQKRKLLVGTPIFADKEYETAAIVKRLFEAGFLHFMSVGLRALEYEEMKEGGYLIKSWELLEGSFVNVAANKHAITLVRGLSRKAYNRMSIEKDFIEVFLGKREEVNKNEIVDVSQWDSKQAEIRVRKWASSDGSGDRDKIDWDKYAKAFAWYDTKNKEAFESYEFLHHDVQKGELILNRNAVHKNFLLAESGVGSSSNTRLKTSQARKHLESHYEYDMGEKDVLKSILVDFVKYYDLFYGNKKVLKVYRSEFKRLRDAMELPKMENEVRSIKQVIDFFKTISYNKLKDMDGNRPVIEIID